MNANRIPVSDVSIRLGLTYPQAYNRVLRGEFGRPERIGRQIFVREEEVQRAEELAQR
jgi:hypothetical protein